MADASSNIKIGMEIGDLRSKAEEFRQALAANGQAVEDFLVKSAKFNKFGELKELNVQSITPSGEVIQQSAKLVKTYNEELDETVSRWKIISTSVKSATDKINAFTDAQKEAREFAQGGFATNLTNLFSTGFFDQKKIAEASIGRQSQLATAQSRLLRTVSESGLTPESVEGIFDRIRQGHIDIETGARGRVQKALLDIVKAYRMIVAEADKAGKKQQELFEKNQKEADKVAEKLKKQTAVDALPEAESQIRRTFPIPPDATIQQIAKYERALERVLKLVASGKVSLSQLNSVLNSRAGAEAQLGGTLVPGQQSSEAQLRALLAGLGTSFDVVEKKSNVLTNSMTRAGKSILISWQGVVRLFESQVLRRISYGIINEIQTSVTKFADLSIHIARIQNLVSRSSEDITSDVKALSSRYNVPIGDAASIIEKTTRSGYSDKKVGENALKLSEVTGLGAGRSTDLLVDTLKSFHLEGDKSEKIANSLFNAFKVGKVDVERLSTSIGHMASSTNVLGLSFEEALAAITTLTTQGIRTTEAVSQIQSLINKLVNPTTELKNLFHEWGVQTGQQAIQTYGFAGVLDKLSETVKKGGSNVQDLIKDFKALKGLTGLGNPFAGYDNALKNITENSQLNKSESNVSGSPGQKFQSTLKSIGNTITTSFGDVFVNTFNKVAETAASTFGAMESGINKIIQLLAELTKAALTFGAIWLTLKAALIIPPIIGYGIASLALNWNALIASMSAAKTALLGFVAVHPAAVVAVAATAGLMIYNYNQAQQAAREAAVATAQISEQQNKKLEQQKDDDIKRLSEETEAVKKEYEKRFKTVLLYIAEVSKEINKAQGDITKNRDKIHNALNAGFEELIESEKRNIQDQLSRVLKVRDDAASKIKQSDTVLRGLRDKAEVDNFERVLKAKSIALTTLSGGGPIASGLLESRETFNFVDKLQKDAIKLFNTDNIEEARKKLEQVEALLGKLLDKQISFREKAAKFGVVFTTPLLGSGSEIGSRVTGVQQLRERVETTFQANQKTRSDSALTTQNQLKQIEKEILNIKEAQLAVTEKIATAQKSGAEIQNQLKINVKELYDSIEKLSKFQEALVGSGYERFGHVDKFGRKITKAEESIEKAKEARDEFDEKPVKTPLDVEKLRQQAEDALKKVREVEDVYRRIHKVRRPGTGFFDKDFIPRDPYEFGGLSLGGIEEQLNKSASGATEGLQNQNKNKDNVKRLQEAQQSNLDAVLNKIPQKYKDMAEAAKNAAKEQKSAADDVNNSLMETLKTIEKIRQQLDGIKSSKPGQIEERGGFHTPPGISLLNPDFEARPSVTAITSNSGRNVNFGDINVTLQGSSSTEKDAREIARMIRREIQRGNSLLS